MQPKSGIGNEQRRKSILVVPSRVISRPDEVEGGEETEIAAQISVPEEGLLGWLVVFSSFWNIFILDGVTFTFGSMLSSVAEDIKQPDSLVALINSVAVALYFLAAPLVSAIINRFGFRATTMSGSIMCCSSLFCAYFMTTYGPLLLFYGVFAGFGYCFVNMSASLVVGFYFERLRSLALAIASSGSSVGIMVLFPLNTYICKIASWRIATLLHAGIFGFVFYFGMTYKPLLSLTVTKTTDDPTRTVTYLPSLSSVAIKSPSRLKTADSLKPTATERLFSAVSNVNFPTAAAVVEDNTVAVGTQPGPSTAAVSRLTMTAHSPQGGISQRQINQVKSIMSRTSMQNKSKKNIEVIVNIDKPKKRSCWARLCHWEEHVAEARPMYRDDAFYDGRMEKLQPYQKSMMDTTVEGKTGLEYQMAVSRAVTTGDLRERRGVFTTAARRILATMMDPKLLKKCSFIVLSASGLILYMGYLVPYVYLPIRNEEAGIEAKHCSLFVSVIGLSNAFGRLALGALACKVEPVKLYYIACMIAGISTIFSSFTFNLYFQYAYCFIFGFFISSTSNLRSMVVVSYYGLDKLTNATGIMLLFQGLGSLISTPLAGMLKDHFGFPVAFYVAGALITFAGFLLITVNSLVNKENKKATRNTLPSSASKTPARSANAAQNA